MILSVIIVNYRVRYFLELCLRSVHKALSGLDAEIIVVDNHSADGSLEQVRPMFPGVIFLANEENVGFAKANNQAAKQARGKYLLYLNPDTMVPENFARRCLSFLEGMPNIGGLGVRMVDGSGRFLRESCRGFPTPWVAFCRLSGLWAMFPKSRLFSGYYLGYLPVDTSHPAPVLSGACIWIARGVMEEVGGFDEQFFMYAEDIDLSYRMEKAGYVNYYLSDTTIVHFKGESTHRDIHYVRRFYRAMSQFRRKHFHRRIPAIFSLATETAIWCRAAIVALIRAVGEGLAGLGGEYFRNRNERVRTLVTGDPAEAASVSSILTAGGERRIVFGEREADEIIFCEGMEFSFRQCIAHLEEDAPYRHGRQVKFHAAGSRAATGSPDPNGRGETLVL